MDARNLSWPRSCPRGSSPYHMERRSFSVCGHCRMLTEAEAGAQGLFDQAQHSQALRSLSCWRLISGTPNPLPGQFEVGSSDMMSKDFPACTPNPERARQNCGTTPQPTGGVSASTQAAPTLEAPADPRSSCSSHQPNLVTPPLSLPDSEELLHFDFKGACAFRCRKKRRATNGMLRTY